MSGKNQNENPCNMEALQFHVKEVERKVDKIWDYIKTDEYTGRKGLYQKVQEHDEYIIESRQKEAVRKGQLVVYGSIGTVATTIIIVLLKLFFPVLQKYI